MVRNGSERLVSHHILQHTHTRVNILLGADEVQLKRKTEKISAIGAAFAGKFKVQMSLCCLKALEIISLA